MNQNRQSSQTAKSISKNTSFFLEHRHDYAKNIQELDTYAAIRHSTNEAIYGTNRLLDIGNGGFFDYDTNIVNTIVGLDLFLDNLPPSYSCPSNVALKNGSALNIPVLDGSFDSVLMAMLIHHLVGKTVHDSLENVRQAIREASRVLCQGGKLIIVESYVSQWFYIAEQSIFPLISPLINRFFPSSNIAIYNIYNCKYHHLL